MIGHGLRLVEDRSLVNIVEDWSSVRSPSRARRRLKLGHPQRIKIMVVPRMEIYRAMGCIIGHPEALRELMRQLESQR